ncbi:B3 domain-containing protein [Hibiscus syriacus]|uniref:B3 domain-containing protein n=1 Tax=Hibiscus syriacus TaxID=106335 RepID=A0A6A3C4D6_HIBSY|nr:B3 domain-containing protein [Hibiscus syriacus]
MAEAELSYEEMRRQRLEENKKRMEELNLKNLSQALKIKSPKSSPGKPRKPRKRAELTSVRRSSRVADNPKPNYKDVPIEPLERLGRSHSRRDLHNRVYASAEERAYAIERAEHLESTLESEYPSFVKPMLQSHVTGGFWLVFIIRAYGSEDDRSGQGNDEEVDEEDNKEVDVEPDVQNRRSKRIRARR